MDEFLLYAEAEHVIALACSLALLDIPADSLWHHALVPTTKAIQAGYKAYDQIRTGGRPSKLWKHRSSPSGVIDLGPGTVYPQRIELANHCP